MNALPESLRYSPSHEWVRVDDNETVTVGITDHAQDLLGDLVYVELPEAGAMVKRGDACATVESVKAASDVYAPLSGEILEINPSLMDAPETVNDSAFADGWLFRLRITDASELEALLDAPAYQALIESDS